MFVDTQPFTANHPQPCSVASFQKELTALFGKHDATGKPWLRIIWAAEDSREPLDWNEWGAGGYGEWRRRYLYSSSPSIAETLDEARGIWLAREVWEDISPPRFVLERFIPPEVACIGWDDNAKLIPGSLIFAVGRDGQGDMWTARRPVDGLYVPLEFDDKQFIRGGVIADHHNHCCRFARLAGDHCYGSYATPGEKHLHILRELKTKMNAAPERRPGLATHEELTAANKRARTILNEYTLGFEDRIRKIAAEAFKTHSGGMLSESPTAQHWGKYFFTAGHNRSGSAKESTS